MWGHGDWTLGQCLPCDRLAASPGLDHDSQRHGQAGGSECDLQEAVAGASQAVRGLGSCPPGSEMSSLVAVCAGLGLGEASQVPTVPRAKCALSGSHRAVFARPRGEQLLTFCSLEPPLPRQ